MRCAIEAFDSAGWDVRMAIAVELVGTTAASVGVMGRQAAPTDPVMHLAHIHLATDERARNAGPCLQFKQLHSPDALPKP